MLPPAPGVKSLAGPHPGLQELADVEGQLQGLVTVQARVAQSPVGRVELGVEDRLATPEALGDLFRRELEVDTTGEGALLLVDGEEPLDLLQDVVEAAGLHASGGEEGVAVHR